MEQNIVNWSVFNFKFSDDPRFAFEKLAYTLFCFEFKQEFGIFRYYNQAYIETMPVKTEDGNIIAFQAKYYDEATKISEREKELKSAIKGAKEKYPTINTFVIYTNKELCASSKKDQIEPQFQINIEEYGKTNGVTVIWKVPSHIEAMLALNPKLENIKDYFFNKQPGLKAFIEKIQQHSSSLVKRIRSDISFKGQHIKIDHSQDAILEFIQSSSKGFVVYGDAGTGKSGYIKDFADYINKNGESSLLIFSATDFDVDESKVFNQFGNYRIEDLLSLFTPDEKKYCIIESVEKYCDFKDIDALQTVIRKFMDNNWKLIFTVRKQYKEGFINTFLTEVEIKEFALEYISLNQLSSLSMQFGFILPSNPKLCELLRRPFNLALYLQMFSDGTTAASDQKMFIAHIWKHIIQGPSQNNNLCVKREEFIKSMALCMLENETYVYNVKKDDDYEAIKQLEKQGIIAPYNDSTSVMVFSHDVYEEIVINHLFDEKYQSTQSVSGVISEFKDSFRLRKMYRIWLESKIREFDSDLIYSISNMLTDACVSQSWKDDTLLAVLNSDNDEVFTIIESLFSANEYSILTRSLFLLNIACKCVKRDSVFYIKSQSIIKNPYRFTKPSGKAWHIVFKYLYEYKASIATNERIVNYILSAMSSWVGENHRGETTFYIGKIALYLKERIWNESDGHGLNSNTYRTINKIILMTAMEIKEELHAIADNIIQNKAYTHSSENFIFLQKSLSNIFDCGKVCEAIPQDIFKLAKEYWKYTDNNGHFSRLPIESDFGLNESLQSQYFPTSAFQTPLSLLLNIALKDSLDFILEFSNYCAVRYKESELNNECSEIQIPLSKDEFISQICSERLWKIYRGSSVAPHVLTSILMALERFLLDYVESCSEAEAKSLCFYLLRGSNNVSITAIVISAVLAFPDKLFDVCCALLQSAEILYLDHRRSISENSIYIFGGLNPKNTVFNEERVHSKNLPFRKNNLVNVILNYQTNPTNIEQEQFEARKKSLYGVIDETKKRIRGRNPRYEAYYYEMDLREHIIAGECENREDSIYIPVKPNLPQAISQYLENARQNTMQLLGDTDLFNWALYHYTNDEKYKAHYHYDDDPMDAYNSIEKYLKDIKNLPVLGEDTLLYTAVVLLQEYKYMLNEEQRTNCINIVLCYGRSLIRNGIAFDKLKKNAIIVELSRLSVSNEICFNWDNPTLILLALMFNYRSYNGFIENHPLKALWSINPKLANVLYYTFFHIVSEYKGEDIILFIDKKQEAISKCFMDTVNINDSIDPPDFEYNTLLYLCILLEDCDFEIFDLVIRVGKSIWKTMFSSDYLEDVCKDSGLELSYINWLAKYLLQISNEQRVKLLQDLMPYIKFSDNFNRLIEAVKDAETENPRYDAFWNLWKLLQEYLFTFFDKHIDEYKNPEKDVRIEFGIERSLVTLLLADLPESEWKSLQPQNRTFYDTSAMRLGYNPTTLYSIARILNGIGKKVFLKEGIIWISEILKNNPHLYRKPLIDDTVYYIEEYIFLFIRAQYSDIKTDPPLFRKVHIILDFLVEKGSSIGYMLRDEII